MSQAAIVRANWRDVPALVRLDRRCSPPGDRFGWITYLSLCIWPGGVTLKAQVDHACVGLVAGDPRRRRGYVNIVTLAVDPGWRRRGIGEQLLRACEAQFDLPRFELQVRQHNTAAIQLYRKLGYAIVGELPRYYGDADGYLMAKERR